MERMTGAEFAAHRYLIGLTLDELASFLGVNPRTVRAWRPSEIRSRPESPTSWTP